MKWLSLLVFALFVAGCGVKGDPMPPEKPAELGRGRPTYKRAMKDIKVNPVDVNEDDEDDNDDEDEE